MSMINLSDRVVSDIAGNTRIDDIRQIARPISALLQRYYIAQAVYDSCSIINTVRLCKR